MALTRRAASAPLALPLGCWRLLPLLRRFRRRSSFPAVAAWNAVLSRWFGIDNSFVLRQQPPPHGRRLLLQCVPQALPAEVLQVCLHKLRLGAAQRTPAG